MAKALKRFYHKLFHAACLAGTDIQPVVLCYKDQQGNLNRIAPFIGDDELGEHLFKVLKEKHIQVEVLVLPRVSVYGKDQRAVKRRNSGDDARCLIERCIVVA
jgi:hypothetical protein